MKLKARTIEILKYFSDVNKKILFQEGEKLAVASMDGSIIATAVLPDTMTKEFAFYDVSEFLGTYSLFEEPNIELKDDYIVITSDKTKNKAKYYYSTKIGIKNVYDTDVKSTVGNELVKFVLEKTTLETAKKASSVLGLGDFKATADGIKILNTESNDMGNEFELEVKDYTLIDEDAINADDYVLFLKDMMFIPDTYEVTFYEGAAYFKSLNGDVAYFIVYKAL